MLNFLQFIQLNERITNIFPDRKEDQEKLQNHLPEIDRQIDKSYKLIGGFLGSRKFDMHKVITKPDESGKPVVVGGGAYKGIKKGRRKLSVIHHNGTKQGKAEVANRIIADDLRTGRAVHHISGDMIGFTKNALAKKGDSIENYVLPFHKVKKLFPDENIGHADRDNEDVKAHPNLPWFTIEVGPEGEKEKVHKIALSGAPEHHEN